MHAFMTLVWCDATSGIMLWHIEHLMLSCVAGLCQFENDQLQLLFIMLSSLPYTFVVLSCAGRCTDERQADKSEKHVHLLWLVTPWPAAADWIRHCMHV